MLAVERPVSDIGFSPWSLNECGGVERLNNCLVSYLHELKDPDRGESAGRMG